MSVLTSEEKRRLKVAMANNTMGGHLAQTLDLLNGKVAGVTWTVGAEATNVINVAGQVTDEEGNDAGITAVFIGVFNDANGTAVNTTDLDFAIGTDGALIEVVADQLLLVITESDGDFDIDITEATGVTKYLGAFMPGGNIDFSGAITFAA